MSSRERIPSTRRAVCWRRRSIRGAAVPTAHFLGTPTNRRCTIVAPGARSSHCRRIQRWHEDCSLSRHGSICKSNCRQAVAGATEYNHRRVGEVDLSSEHGGSAEPNTHPLREGGGALAPLARGRLARHRRRAIDESDRRARPRIADDSRGGEIGPAPQRSELSQLANLWSPVRARSRDRCSNLVALTLSDGGTPLAGVCSGDGRARWPPRRRELSSTAPDRCARSPGRM